MSAGEMDSPVCPRCSAVLPAGGGFCPECGWGGSETPVFLVGGALPDGFAAVVGGLVPLAVAAAALLFGTAWPVWLLPGAGGLLLLELLLFFTVLRPYQSLRKALAFVFCVYTLPFAFMAGCIAVSLGPGDREGALYYVLACVGLLLLQAALFVAAFRRR